VLPLDVALVHVSPPDRHGFCSLGTSVDVARAAVERRTDW
jgi:acyl-CoA hydrolase